MPAIGQKRKSSEEIDEASEEKRRITEELTTTIQSLDGDGAESYLNQLCDAWHIENPPSSFEHVLAIAFHNFGGDSSGDIDINQPGSYGLRDVDDKIHTKEIEAIALYHQLRELDMLSDESTLARMTRVLESIYYAKRIVLATYQARISLKKELTMDDDLDARLNSFGIRFRWLDADINEVQKLLLHLLDTAMERKYRKQGDLVFEPIQVDGYETHAWRYVCDIKEFVYRECQKEIQLDAWLQLTNGANNAKTVVEFLKNCNDYQFRWLKKDRHVFAFRNGVYMAKHDRFYPFGGERLGDSIVACKFFDMDFDEFHGMSWRDIPTPAVQSVLDYQGFSAEVSDFLYILIGRMLYDVGEGDGWQVIPYLLGTAGTGKSSITLNVVAKLYGPEDVGLLSNNVERQFGLSAFYDKLIFVAPEIKSDVRLEQAEFQSMVSGEEVQIAIKHKSAFSHKWSTPGFLAGNELVGWADNSGSIQRRLCVFRFDKRVVNGDMRLGDRLEAELGSFLVKANRAYREASETFGSTNLWEVLPDYFKGTRDELAASVNSVEAFLHSSEVTLESGVYCPFDEFKAALRAYEHANGFKTSKYTADFFRGPFSKFALSRVRDTLEYRGRLLKREYVMGVDLATIDMATDNLLG